MADPAAAAIDRHLSGELRSALEERFWRPVADHGIVHVRDVAAGVVELAATVDNVLLPRRPSDRREFVVSLAVIVAYVHDVGLSEPTSSGRRSHVLYGAHFPFSGDMDDVIGRLQAEAGPVVRRIAAVAAAAPFGVASGVVLRELISLAVAHSKSAVPAAALGDMTALQRRMRHIVLTDLDRHRGAEATPAAADPPTDGPGANARWYGDPLLDPYAWLASRHPAQRALADDAVDAVRLVRAADALRRRATTLRTPAGYEIVIDADSGSAVIAMRTEGNERLLLLRAANPVNAGEANLRRAIVTPHGNLRVALHRGRFSSPAAVARACEATASAVAEVGADVLGAFAFRRPSPDLGEPRRRGTEMRVELERPADEPAFADAVVAALDPSLAERVCVVADLESAAPAERARYLRAIPVLASGDEATHILRALRDHGLKVTTIDRRRAFEDVRRVALRAGEVLVEAGTWPAFVYVAVEPGLEAQPLDGHAHDDMPAWYPIGVTGVVRRAERNATVVAVASVEVLMIPGELFVREWFHPYDEQELAGLLARRGDG